MRRLAVIAALSIVAVSARAATTPYPVNTCVSVKQRLAATYHDEHASRGRWHRLVVAAHPSPGPAPAPHPEDHP